jgi:membrane protein implicated in regulation of membrane protease activity
MFGKIARLFKIKTRLEAFAVIYALAVGAVGRGYEYMEMYPGPAGYLLFAACSAAVFMAGAKILDSTQRPRKSTEDRRNSGRDRRAQPSAG